MPYALSLQSYTLPEFYEEAPADWVRKLREISPITDSLAHLRFRYFKPREDWLYQERGIWVLYSCTPKALVPKSRAELYDKHWSELSINPEARVPDSPLRARKALVSDYQHFMWHTQGVEARPFWFLQGGRGGTPAVYTRYEERMLDACNAVSEPFPIGFFPACPFDERAVKAIAARDRFYKASMDMDALEKQDKPDALKAEDMATEIAFRKKWLDWWYEQIQPQKEYMSSVLFKKEESQLPPAPKELPNTLAHWKETFVEHGSIAGAGVAGSRKSNVLVK